MKKIHFLIISLLVLSFNFRSFSQVLIGETGSPLPSAMLELRSDSRGLLIPRMTQTEYTSIPSPALGLMIFCTTDNTFYIHNGDNWESLSGDGDTNSSN